MTQRQRSKKAWVKWRGLVSEQARSGQSVATFCRERSLGVPHFYWWKKRLREGKATKFVEVQVAELSAQAPSSDSRIELRLRNGRSLLIGRGFDPEQVRVLLAVVEAAG
jgi:hypothetical protein